MAGRHSAVPAQPSKPEHHDHGDHAGHSHGGPPPPIEIAQRARIALITFLAVVAVAVVVGAGTLLATKHHHPSMRYLSPGTTLVKASVTSINGTYEGGRVITVMMKAGPEKGDIETVQSVPQYVISGGLKAGDVVSLTRSSNGTYSWSSGDLIDRSHALWLLVGLFVIVVLVVARLRGLLAMVGLCVAAAVVWEFMIPALLGGQNGTWVALVGSAAIMYVVLYLAHGWSLRTSTALAGTLFGLAIVVGLGMGAAQMARFSGVIDENALNLNAAINLDPRNLAMCALILVSLGLLNDVTVTQASAVWELRAAAPNATRRELFGRGMRIGRDHIASTIYTIVFAYAGTALTLLVTVALFTLPLGQLLQMDAIAEDVVRTLAAAIGLVLAVPVTTALAVAVVGGESGDRGASAYGD